MNKERYYRGELEKGELLTLVPSPFEVLLKGERWVGVKRRNLSSEGEKRQEF